jgi:anti-anti-sigma factor
VAEVSTSDRIASGLKVRVLGEIELVTAGEVESRLLDLLNSGFEAVVLDLREVSFMDSSGIRVLIIAHQCAEERSRICRSWSVHRPAAERWSSAGRTTTSTFPDHGHQRCRRADPGREATWHCAR